MSVTLAAGCVCGLGVVFAGIALGGLTESDAPFWLAAVAVPGAIQYRVLEGVLRGQGRFGAMNLLAVCLPATTLGALLVIEATSSLTVTTAVQVWSLSFLAPVVVGYALVGRSSWPRALPGPARIRRIVVFGAQGQLGNLIQLLNYRLDSYLVLIFVGAGGVGLYAVGVSLSEGMWFVANSVAVVLLTDLSAGDQASAGRMTAVVCRNTLLVTAIAALAAAPLAPFIIPLVFGADFDGSVVPFLLLLPGTVALAGVKVLAAYIFSRGRPIINAYIAIAALIVTVSADLALIPWLGVAGAALGSSLAYGVSLALTLAVYRSLSGHPVLEPVTPRRSDAELYLQAFRSLAGRGAR
jgi:O-antigen/teichoic acid export membrane protein